jgi:hypothetical protein
MKTLNGDETRYMVIYEDGEKVTDIFGDEGQATATREEAELLADEHRAAGSAVTVLALDEEEDEEEGEEENGGPCGGCEGWGRNAVTGNPCQWCGGAGIGR